MTTETTSETDGVSSPDEVTVRTLLAAAGILASQAEVAHLAVGYPELRRMVELLHAVPEARYESPALSFDPTPVFTEWG